MSSDEVDHFCPSEHRLAVLKQNIKVYQTHTMPEAVSASLPTAGTVPHTDDESSPELIQIPRPYPHGCSTVLLLERMTPVVVCFTVVGPCRGEKTAFHGSTGNCSLSLVVCLTVKQ